MDEGKIELFQEKLMICTNISTKIINLTNKINCAAQKKQQMEMDEVRVGLLLCLLKKPLYKLLRQTDLEMLITLLITLR